MCALVCEHSKSRKKQEREKCFFNLHTNFFNLENNQKHQPTDNDGARTSGYSYSYVASDHVIVLHVLLANCVSRTSSILRPLMLFLFRYLSFALCGLVGHWALGVQGMVQVYSRTQSKYDTCHAHAFVMRSSARTRKQWTRTLKLAIHSHSHSHLHPQEQLLRNRMSDCIGVVLLGSSVSGKTTLFHQLLQQPALSGSYTPTQHSTVVPFVLNGGTGKAGVCDTNRNTCRNYNSKIIATLFY